MENGMVSKKTGSTRHRVENKIVLPFGLNDATFECIPIAMREFRRITGPPPDIPGRPKDWREQIKADLAAQVEAGGTLYGVRSDGAYIARTKDGDRVLSMPAQKQA